MFPPLNDTQLLPEPSPAQIDEVLPDRLRVRWQASIWNARVIHTGCARSPIPIPGQTVLVIGLHGIELLVQL